MKSSDGVLTMRTVRDSVADHVTAFQTALEQFGAARVDDFLPEQGHPARLEILCELVLAKLQHCTSTGVAPAIEAYRERFPDLFANPEFAYRLDEFDRVQPHARTRPGLRHLPGAPSIVVRPGFEATWNVCAGDVKLPNVGDDFLGFGLLAELGRGGFGKVFLAQQGQLAGRLVALKVATGLFSESQTLAQLQHTHIVPIYSYHHSQPLQAVCMPYLGATTLAHVLEDIRTQPSLPSSGQELLSTLNERKKKTTQRCEESIRLSEACLADSLPERPRAAAVAMPPVMLELQGLSYVDSVLWLAVRLADGLAHAHERGIIHRDIKPANILITDDGQPMLLDFNLAHDARQHQGDARASIGGTLPYMAPEHLEAFRGGQADVDARSDIFALGVILFELLTGAAPFPSYRKLPVRDQVERMIRDRHTGAPHLRPLNAMIPPAVEAIVRYCLEPAPAARYRTARLLREDLQRQLENRPLRHAANPSLWERCGKFRRRHPRLTSMTSVAAVACVILGALTGLFAAREDQRATLEARSAFARFDEDAQSAYFNLNARSDQAKLDEGERAARATLAHFQVLEDPAWRDAPAVRRLSQPEQDRLHANVGQLLVLLAHAQQVAGQRENDGDRRAQRFQAGLQFCALASGGVAEEHIPQALWSQQGNLHKLLDQRARAEKCFARARQADLKTVQDRYLTARALAEEGKFRAALPLVKEAVRLCPQDFNLHFLQGICHDYLAQNTEAIACYRACIALRPRFHGAFYNRGLAHLRQSDFHAAFEDFDQTLKLRPDFTEAHVSRASALQGQKKFRAASADLSEALERGHAPTRLYFLRARVREQAGDRDGAQKDRTEGMRLEPSDEPGWIARGLAFLPGDPQEALHSFDQALAIDPRSLAALQNKAHVLGKYFKRLEDAVQSLDKAVELYPDDCRPRAGRGVYLGRLGKRAAALKDAEQALLLDTSASNQYQVAGIYALTSRLESDDRREALRLLSAALKKGFGFDYLEIDRDLDPIRATPAFRRVVEAARALRTAG